jgi:hypothetical protein
MILKIFLPKNLAKKLAVFFTQNKAKFGRKDWFLRKTPIFFAEIRTKL